MNDESATKFGQSLRGTLIQRNDPDYDEARKLYDESGRNRGVLRLGSERKTTVLQSSVKHCYSRLEHALRALVTIAFVDVCSCAC